MLAWLGMVMLSILIPPVHKYWMSPIVSRKFPIPDGYKFLFDIASVEKVGKVAAMWEINWQNLTMEWGALLVLFLFLLVWHNKKDVENTDTN